MDLAARLTLGGRRRGDAIVEFALLAPILMLLLFGVLEISRVLDAWIIVQSAAREGARAGVQTHPDSAIAATAQQAASDYLTSALGTRLAAGGDVSRIVIPTPVVVTDAVQVTAEVDVQIYTPLMQIFFPSPFPVRASAALPR